MELIRWIRTEWMFLYLAMELDPFWTLTCIRRYSRPSVRRSRLNPSLPHSCRRWSTLGLNQRKQWIISATFWYNQLTIKHTIIWAGVHGKFNVMPDLRVLRRECFGSSNWALLLRIAYVELIVICCKGIQFSHFDLSILHMSSFIIKQLFNMLISLSSSTKKQRPY